MLHLNLDIGEILDLAEMKGVVNQAMQQAARDLAKMTEAKVKDLARQRLHSRYDKYIEGLSTFEVTKDVWVVNLSAKVRWIEDGQDEFSMLDHLLASKKAKTAKDGSKYVVVPFDQGPGKGPKAEGGASGQANQDLIATIKAEMKRRKIPFSKVEKNAGGLPQIGRLHEFNITERPIKTEDGPGQGKGPIGQVRQGPTGIPFLQGVNVYQTLYKDKDGNDRVRRSIVTFRTASSKHQGSGRWDHPGNDAVNIMEEALEWARREWETTIEPEVRESIYASLG